MAKRTKPLESLDPLARAVVAALGGTAETARIFGIKQPSVTGWLAKGIPKSRLMYLDAVYPEVMRLARKVKNGDVIERAAASDDVQAPVGTPENKPKGKASGGRSRKKIVEARARS